MLEETVSLTDVDWLRSNVG